MKSKVLFLVLFTILLSQKINAQCDIVYYNTTNDTCLVDGDDLILSYSSPVLWNIINISNNGGQNGPQILTPQDTITWNNATSGTYVINIYNTGFPPTLICSDTIIISPGILNFQNNPINLSFCQWNTIDLDDIVNNEIINETNPQYTYSINGIVVNGSSYNLIDSGEIVIDVNVIDGSGCVINGQIILDVIPNNINTQSFSISDTVIQFCSTTDVEFSIDNPDTNFTYNWNINGQDFLDTSYCEYTFNGSPINLPNPGYFDIQLEIIDSNGCDVVYYDQITSLGIFIPNVNTFSVQFGDAQSPGCVFDSTSGNSTPIPSIYWVELVDNGIVTPITEMGPLDTIFWKIYCEDSAIVNDSPDIYDDWWIYSDLPNLIRSNPTNPNSPDVAALEQTWFQNSCNCKDEEFTIYVDIQPACDAHYDIQVSKRVDDPVEAEFFFTSPVCQQTPFTIQNNSRSGCDGTTYNSDEDTVFYHWDFGNCFDTTISVPVNQSNSDSINFPAYTYDYPLPGIYNISLNAISFVVQLIPIQQSQYFKTKCTI